MGERERERESGSKSANARKEPPARASTIGQPEATYKVLGHITKLTYTEPTTHWYTNEYELAKLLLNETGSVEAAKQRINFIQSLRTKKNSG